MSAFKASGFGAFASQPSPLGALGGSKSPSPFGSQTSSIKSTSIFGGPPKTKPSEGGFAAFSSPGKSVFGNSSTGGLGGSKTGFGGAFGGSFGSGFGGLVKGGISSFAGSGGSGITGLSDKPAKPFGAAEDEDEEDGSGSEDHEEGDAKAQQIEEVKKDKRFYEQEGKYILPLPTASHTDPSQWKRAKRMKRLFLQLVLSYLVSLKATDGRSVVSGI